MHNNNGGCGWAGAKAPFVFDGALDTEVLQAYVEHVLGLELKAGDRVVLDNLRCHVNIHVWRLIEKADAQIWFLPPYSPDLNPIEKIWLKVKAYLRKGCSRTQEALYQAIADALATITVDDASGWLQSCGYTI